MIGFGSSSDASARSRFAYPSAPLIQDRYCLQGRSWGYPGNCQFSTYAQCMATASGTDAYCGENPQYLFRRPSWPAYR
jgi:hypothetical protein